jgi:hypothetical protein
MIQRPSLAGIAIYKGEVLEGVETVWPAIVDRDLWDKAQAIINNPARRTSPGNVVRHLASGVTFCQCGLPMRAGTNSTKLASGFRMSFTVYRCAADRGGHSTIKKDVLDPAVRRGVIDAMWRAREKPATAPDSDDEETLAILNSQLDAANARERRLAENVADDTITKESARALSRTIRADIKQLNDQIGRLTVRSASAGAEESMWEAIWERIDPSGDVMTPNPDGKTQRFWAGRAFIQAMIAGGMTEAEAKTKMELGRRFDNLELEARRALVRTYIRVTVRRGSAKDRIAILPA